MNLERYNEEQKRWIERYFQLLRENRKSGKISQSILENEVKYWEKFSVSTVIRSLQIHIEKYPSMKENYTRGIMRNVSSQEEKVETSVTTNIPARSCKIAGIPDDYPRKDELYLEILYLDTLKKIRLSESKQEQEQWREKLSEIQKEKEAKGYG